MVIKGNPRGGPAGLAKHLQRTDTNERVEILQLRGVAANELTGALHEMDALGSALRTHRTLYHASINVPAHERMTPEQRAQAIDRLESALGLTGQPRAIVEHEKQGRAGEGRIHWHVVWSRTDLEHMRAIRCDHNYRTHELVARELEREFGHARVQGVHVERDGPNGERVVRPDRTPSHAEMQQAQRSGFDPAPMRAEISALWQTTDSGKAFAAALEEKGYILCPGDRRDFVIVDRAGGVHSLARRIEGVTAKDVRARMTDIDPASLPSIADARGALREAARVERYEEKLKKRALNPLEQRVDRVIKTGLTGREFRDALGGEGIILAKVTERDVQTFAAKRTAKELLSVERDRAEPRGPKVERDQIVAVTRRGNVYQLNPQRLDPGTLARAVGRSLPSVHEARDAWAFARGFVANNRAAIQADRISRSQAFEAGRAREATVGAANRGARGAIDIGSEGFGKAANIVGRSIIALASAALGFLEGLFSPARPPTREQVKQSERVAVQEDRRAALRAHVAELTERQSTIIDQSRAQQRERDQETRDQAWRERQRDDGRTR